MTTASAEPAQQAKTSSSRPPPTIYTRDCRINKLLCPYCRKLYAKSALPQHIRSRLCQQATECFECNKTFTTPGPLQRHIKSYHKDLRWKLDTEEKRKRTRICPFCQHKFNNISAVQKHILRMHQGEEKAAEYKPNHPENSSSSLSILPSPFEISLSVLSEEPREDIEQEVKIRKGSYKHACHICAVICSSKVNLSNKSSCKSFARICA
jgi:hypothetical protein